MLVGALLLAWTAGAASQVSLTRWRLPGGVRLVWLRLPKSDGCSLFSYLPLGLARDSAGRAQWSHLVEHMILRTTVPDGAAWANAETLPDHMRLDWYGDPAHLSEGLLHQAHWLNGLPYPAQRLETERTRLLSEAGYAVSHQATSKLALAAWGQAWLGGQRSVHLQGDVKSASVAQLQAYRQAQCAGDDRIVLCGVGDVEPETFHRQALALVGRLQVGRRRAVPPRHSQPGGPVTWDLPAQALVLTWRIPGPAHPDYPALLLASRALMMACASDIPLRLYCGQVVAGADLEVGGQWRFYLTTQVKPGVSFETARQRIRGRLDTLQLNSLASQVALELKQPQIPPRSSRQIAMNAALYWGMLEWRYGEHLGGLPDRLSKVDEGQFRQVCQRYLKTPESELWLKP